ncbi:MAG: outer membrane protein assembly factor BamD [Bacteroidota bacterium]|nr:outer membrane protein assembly factor BamD [Bacteroidota bacterium]
MMKNILQILLVAFILNSCGKYQKVLRSDDYNYKYEQAVAYYEDGDYNRAMPLFNELSTVMKGTAKIQEVSFYYAYCNYSTGDNVMAAYLFRNYTINFPNSKHTEECAYMVAYCYYNEAPIYSLDATNTHRAIKELQSFIDRYPTSARIEKCNELIDELRAKLSLKAFENAKQYYSTSNYKSAIIALDNVLIDFPLFNNREEVHFLIVKSTYLLAINSISTKVKKRLKATLEAYSHFKDNYPTSNYLQELETTYNKTQTILTKLKQTKDEI